jgi:hypothetical protein
MLYLKFSQQVSNPLLQADHLQSEFERLSIAAQVSSNFTFYAREKKNEQESTCTVSY